MVYFSKPDFRLGIKHVKIKLSIRFKTFVKLYLDQILRIIKKNLH